MVTPATNEAVASTGGGYRILRLVYAVAPVLFGADKFFHLLVDWDKYLAPIIRRQLPVSGPTFMNVVGVIEIVAGILVALSPRIGGYVVAAWLWGIVINLLLIPGYFDVALRDLVISMGALALARSSSSQPRPTDSSSKTHAAPS
ncbi:MAG: hypothetical protein HY332_20295 [Chloroflexi bacterium]|nr:hypothetical protein [Chloroflexota bacterium]